MLNFDRQADIEIEVDKSEKRVVLRHISGVAKLGKFIKKQNIFFQFVDPYFVRALLRRSSFPTWLLRR
jgi:hypothetical protein